MNNFKSIDEIVENYQTRYNEMADQADGVPTAITNEMIDLVHLEMCKDVDEVVAQEKSVIKSKNKMYKKLLNAKRKIATLEKADAWFDKVFQKYFNKGILEHLIVYAIKFLYNQFLFVPKRFFALIGNDEMLAQFTFSAMEYLGWTMQNESVEETTTDNAEDVDEQHANDETTDNNEDNQQEVEITDVTVYEPKELQPTDQQTQPVVKVERTITHEVVTAAQGITNPVTVINDDAAADDDEQQAIPLTSQEEVPHRFHRPGGKSGKKS